MPNKAVRWWFCPGLRLCNERSRMKCVLFLNDTEDDYLLTKDMERQFQGVWREFAATRDACHTMTVGSNKLVQIYQCAAIEHQKVFPKYRNCNKGRDLVILASGPTLDYYNLKSD